MELRPALLPPSNERHEEFTRALAEAFDRLSREAPDEVAPDLSRQLGMQVAGGDLEGWAGSIDPEQAAAQLLRPPPHELRKLAVTQEELLELARRFMGDADPSHSDWYMAVFDANVPHPDGAMLAFYPPEGEADPTPEAVVQWATSYRAIQL